MKPIFLSLLSLSICCIATAQNTVIKAGHLFDSKTGKMLTDQTIIIRYGKIVEVGSNLKYTTRDTLIDLSKS